MQIFRSKTSFNVSTNENVELNFALIVQKS